MKLNEEKIFEFESVKITIKQLVYSKYLEIESKNSLKLTLFLEDKHEDF